MAVGSAVARFTRRTPAPGPPSANRPATDALDAIAVGIANLIDADAAAEMWDRWRRGDNDAFSRRLYTAQGQQTFDEIRRRCRADPQFRETVERYTQEFERLLAKVGHNDRDGSQARAYLLSDTGKVYTMLAHASGTDGSCIPARTRRRPTAPRRSSAWRS